MNHVVEKMYYNGREIVLQEKEGSSLAVITCHGCVLKSDNYCTANITPAQSKYVCCPKGTGKYYIFKFKE